MPSIDIQLKRDIRGEWYLYAPKGHTLAGPFRGNQYDAYNWGKKWCSTWREWNVVQSIEGNYAQED